MHSEETILQTPEESEQDLVELDHEREIDTLIVSDIHLGSDVSRSARLTQLIRSYRFRRLILNGDVFDDLNFTRLTKQDWRFLSFIRKLSNPRRGIEVVWVVGNHDGGVSEILSHLLGVPVFEQYQWSVEGHSMLAIHGHQFDSWINEHAVITEIATWLYWVIQKLDREHNVARWVKRRSKRFLRLTDRVGSKASSYGRALGVQTVTCGHTHLPIITTYDDIQYVNSGCWTDKPSSYVTVDLGGTIHLRTLM
jgi:UDP-2,3-diacylglucosamine pyrophosphatase LpxH